MSLGSARNAVVIRYSVWWGMPHPREIWNLSLQNGYFEKKNGIIELWWLQIPIWNESEGKLGILQPGLSQLFVHPDTLGSEIYNSFAIV